MSRCARIVAPRWLLAALPLLVAACAAPQSEALRRAPPAAVPAVVELSDVPFHPQTPLHCGPAALATVLGHVGVDTTPEGLTPLLYLPAREGSLQLELLATARRQGALAVPLPGTLQAVLTELAAGHAVLVLQNLGLAIAPTWHYAVVVGHDLPHGEVLLRSGTERRRVMSIDTFEHTWARAGHWAVVVLPPGRLPASANEADVLQATLAFERVAAPAPTASAWAALLQRWPDNLPAAIGLGNALAASGDVDGAVRVLEQAASRHDSAAAWHNLALVQLRRGEREAARAAAERALAAAAHDGAQARWRGAAQRTLDDIGR